MSVVEAMANKVPVIAGKNSGGVAEILSNGQYGIVTDIDTIEDIANEAIRILKSEEVWNSYVSVAYEEVCNKYSSENIGNLYLDYYQKIIREKDALKENGCEK